ncbi:MAG: DUF58 domain-containing protein [Alloprevotella sp.]
MDERIQKLMQKVRRIEIKTQALTNNVFAGEYHSAFKGRGMSFSEVREYQPGDDIRDIDWNVTARFDRTYVKVFEEERELTVLLLIDVSGSLDFGTKTQSQRDLLTEIAATLAFSAIRNNDKIGVIFFSDHCEKFIPPAKGRAHILRIIREMLTFKPQSSRTDIAAALEFMMRVQRKKCIAFLLSDFFDSRIPNASSDSRISRNVAMVARHHDLIAIRVYDRCMEKLPNVGLVKMEDAETGHKMIVDTSSRKVREAHAQYWNSISRSLDFIFRRSKVAFANVSTGTDFVIPLKNLFAHKM